MKKPEKTPKTTAPERNSGRAPKKRRPCPECREPLTQPRPLVVALSKRVQNTGVEVRACPHCGHVVIAAAALDRALAAFITEQTATRARLPKELRKEFMVRMPASVLASIKGRAEAESKSANSVAVNLLLTGLQKHTPPE